MRRPAKPLLALVLFLTAGCSSQPTRFFVLSSLGEAEAEPAAASGAGPSLGIGPLELPDYLDRPQIVTRSGENELTLGEFDQWAEPLADGLVHILGENLAALVNAESVAFFPWKRATPIDYQIVVEVTRFEVDAQRNAALIARWTILGRDGKETLATRKSTLSRPTRGQDYPHAVAAMSETVAELSRAIADEIRAVAPGASGGNGADG